jgi:TetR/AcrR family transcriptional regulator, transcriptional repressor for nem operon
VAARANETRDRLIAIAGDLFHRKGFAGASFEEIVRASGVQRGNIYYYFKTKDEILEAVLERRLEDVRATIASWEEKIPEPLARLERFVEMVFGRAAELAEHGCPIGTLTSELGKGDGERRARARRLFDAYRDFAAAQLRALGRSPAESRELACELLARCQGAAVLAHAYGDPALLGRRTASVRAWLRELASAPRSAPPRAAKRPARAASRR